MHLHEAGNARRERHAHCEDDHRVGLAQGGHNWCATEDHSREKGAKTKGSRGLFHIEDARIASHVQHVDAAHTEPTDQEDYWEGNCLRLLQSICEHSDAANGRDQEADDKREFGAHLLEEEACEED